MIELQNGYMVEDASELPSLSGSSVVYCDVETTSRDPRKKSTDPWRDCWTAGIAITVDDDPRAWYVPIEHQYGPRVDKETAAQWLADVMYSADSWANQNVKYDVHVVREDLGVEHLPPLRCLLTGAKLVDSDMTYKGGYGLDNLSRRWLGADISALEEELQPYLGKSNKDYGRIPADVVAPYACEDVLTARRLDRYEQAMIPEESQLIWGIEQRVTRILADAERYGLLVDPQELKVTQLRLLRDTLEIERQLHELTGEYVRPHVNEDVFDLLCNHYGLPVLGWTDEGNPSFDKEALKRYLVLPDAPMDVIEKMLECRSLSTLRSVFVDTYLDLHIDGLLHPDFNQIVRTGRMSCKRPNAQQLSEAAKRLIKARTGRSLLKIDFSQIEYRIIAHYIQDRRIIRAYCEDPDVDFHNWVAELCGMTRRPAKTVNFAAGYGMGRDKTSRLLAMDADVVGAIRDRVRAMVERGEVPPERQKDVFDSLAKKHAEHVYDEYHQSMPTLKRTARRAGQVARHRGYSRTLSGRRRHLPKEFAHVAFNAVCQGFAADYMKERLVAMVDVILSESIDANLLALVHDEYLLDVPEGEEDRIAARLIEVLEDSSTFPQLRVPMRCAYGYGKDWASADGKATVPPGDRFSRFTAVA